MKKGLTILTIALLFSHLSYSQITITDIDPLLGDQFTLESFDTEFDAGPAGADVTWNFSDLDSSSSEIDYVVVLPDDLEGEEDYPLSTKVWIASLDGLGDLSFFMGSENNTIVEYGAYMDVGGSVTQLIYSDPQKRVDSPLNYEDTGSDDFEGEINIAGSILSTFTGDISYVVDAYGSLILPNTSYSDVLRVKSIREEEQEVLPGVTSSTIITSYSYYIQDYPIPLITTEESESYFMDELIEETSSVMHLVSYSSMALSVESSKVQPDIKIYPNPSSDFITINYNGLDLANLRIINSEGKVVMTTDIFDNDKIKISDLPQGFYIVEIHSKNSFYSRSSFIIKR